MYNIFLISKIDSLLEKRMYVENVIDVRSVDVDASISHLLIVKTLTKDNEITDVSNSIAS